ncbi:MAG: Intracellular proteinase inhibitor [Gemmatimonadetes bacterium]|nr:Intracellular proteinase inhibitor [Gemmatimonadota bacterium]
MICERSRPNNPADPTRPNREMNTRLIISLLCAGALAFACGPRSRSEAPSALATAQPVRVASAAERPRRHDSASARADVKLTSQLKVDVAPREVRIALDVKNIGGKHAEIDFPSGQSYDIAVVDSAGREVWRWAKGRMFTQSVQNKQLGGGESMQVAESWTPKAGRYVAIATLTSSNYPVEQRAEFVVP